MPAYCSELSLNSGIEMTVDQIELLQKLFHATLAHNEKERTTLPEIVNLFETGSMQTDSQTFEILLPSEGDVKHPKFQVHTCL